MATIYIDNSPHSVAPDQNLLQAALTLGFDLPYFCWHPALGSVGACRQCAVKQFRDRDDLHGRLVMACMLPVAEGLRISIQDPEARDFRKSVIEWLMTNHPHDCPVCDEGGECHLQDMTVMTGHAYRRYRFAKRTFRNQFLGPFINHEMNRCIQCYRCVRFYKDYAGGTDLDAFASHNAVYFGRLEDGVLENEFSGNLVEVCPTGVFTDKTFKQHFTRKWDLQTAPSVCVHCGLGCNTILGERYGEVRRVLNRYHRDINGYFLCDRGRFGYPFVNHPRRLRNPWWRLSRSEKLRLATKDEVLQQIGSRSLDRKRIIGIGSPRASLESNYALRAWVGPERFFSGALETEYRALRDALEALRNGRVGAASLHQIEQADVVLNLGEDVTNTAPRMALALRQSVRQQPLRLVDTLKVPRWLDKSARDIMREDKGPLFIAFPGHTRLDEVARQTYHAPPDAIARLGFAVAHALDPAAPEVPGLRAQTQELAETIARALKEGDKPLIVSGVSLGSRAIVQAAANIAWALQRTGRHPLLNYVVPGPNSIGLELLGARHWSEARGAVKKGEVDAVVILENDLMPDTPAEGIETFFDSVKLIVALDCLETKTTLRSDVVLPCGTHAESDGTFISNETRAQRFFQVLPPQPPVQESWRWIGDLMVASGHAPESPWTALDDLIAAVAAELPVLSPIVHAAPLANSIPPGQRIARAPRRFSGRTAITAKLDVHEPKPPEDRDGPLTFSMEGSAASPPPACLTHYWAAGWNSVQALNKFQAEVGGPLRGGDPGVRLVEPAAAEDAPYCTGIPGPFFRRAGELLVVPFHHIFGSEPLSALAPGIAGLAPEPYLALSASDAAGLKVASGDPLVLRLAGREYPLRAKVQAELPDGLAGLPVGLGGLAGIELPAWGRCAAAPGTTPRT